MNILLIGNSYSVDASRYLQKIARKDGVTINTVCLYIGGCPLEAHFRNMHSELEKYELFINGEKSGFFVSLKEALLNRSWDIITMQQASNQSFEYENYQPYLNTLNDYVKTLCPKAKIYIHETWCDAPDSPRLSGFGFEVNKEMLDKLVVAYEQAKDEIKAEGIIRSGELVYKLYDNNLSPVWRDLGHLSLGLGRFAVGLLWYKTLLNGDVMANTFNDLDEEVSSEDILKIKELVLSIN